RHGRSSTCADCAEPAQRLRGMETLRGARNRQRALGVRGPWRHTAPMSGAASHRGSVDRPARSFPSRPILAGVVLLAACLYGGAARAGTLYQCTGSSGETVYSSSRAGYRACHAISSYAEPKARVRTRPRERTSLTGVAGTVATTARSLFADGSQPVSLAGVRGSVATTPRAADAMPPAPRVAGASANRVLRGAVYRIVRADGSVEYTNVQPSGGKGRAVTMLFSYIATCAACNLHSTIHWNSVALNLDAYADTIRAASIEYGVDEAFLRAIIHAESAFNPRALSLKGAQGLMQLMPTTASDMGVLDAFNSDQNIRGGARYLSLLLHDFNGNERLAAAAYNAGPGAVQRYKGIPPYAETEVYVERVETLRKRYGEAIHPPLASRGPS